MNIFEHHIPFKLDVYFEIPGLSNRKVHGVIISENLKMKRYLEVTLVNSDDINEIVFNSVDDNDIHYLKIDIIKCHLKKGGTHILLINNKIYDTSTSGWHSFSFNIYFDYLINGSEKLNTLSDLKFSELEFSFENMYDWIFPKKINEREKALLRIPVSVINNKKSAISFIYTETNIPVNESNIKKIEKDVKIILKVKNDKFSIEEIYQIVRYFETLFTCLIGESAFCLNIFLRNRRGSSKYYYSYNLLIAGYFSEPRFSLKHPMYSFFPFPLQDEKEFSGIIRNYFQNIESASQVMRKLSSTILYEKKFFYELKFNFIASLVETCFRYFSINDEYKPPHFDPNKFRELTDPLLKGDISKRKIQNIKTYIDELSKPSLKDKIIVLESFQYNDCKLISFEEFDLTTIVKSRNLLSHGENLEKECRGNLQPVMEKLTCLIFYTVWKFLGFSVNTISDNLIKSSHRFLQFTDQNELRINVMESFGLETKDFEKLKVQPRHYYVIIEKTDSAELINIEYTEIINNDFYLMNYKRSIHEYLGFYYGYSDDNLVAEMNSCIILDKDNAGEKIERSYVRINLSENFKRSLIRKEIIPSEVYKIMKTKKIPLITAYREYKNFTLAELAEKSGLNIQTLKKYEKRIISRSETYHKILKTLGANL